MKSMIFLFLLTIATSSNLLAQVEKDSLGFERFEYQKEDTTYVMQKYFIVFLKQGPNRNHEAEEAARIQEAHLAHLGSMTDRGLISMAGPFDSDGEIRGIVVFNVATIEEVEKYTSQDPAVTSGRLIMEIHPWWAAKGSILK